MAKPKSSIALVAQYRGAEDDTLTGSLAKGDADALAAIEAASLDRNTRWLGGPASRAPSKVVRKAAGAALHKLKSSGVAVEAAAPVAAWSLGTESVDLPPPVALMGAPGLDGYFPFLAITFGREGACVCTGMAGAGQGVRRDDHGHISKSRAREFIQNVEREGQLWQVPFQAAMHFLERAFREGGQKPNGWGHLVEHLSAAERSAIDLVDPLRSQEQDLVEDALFQTAALLDGEPTVAFMLDEQALASGWNEVKEASESKLDIDAKAKEERIQAVVDRVADEALRDIHRRTYALALDVVAFLASERGWDDTARSTARHTALALRTDRKGSRIPLVRALAERMLVQAAE